MRNAPHVRRYGPLPFAVRYETLEFLVSPFHVNVPVGAIGFKKEAVQRPPPVTASFAGIRMQRFGFVAQLTADQTTRERENVKLRNSASFSTASCSEGNAEQAVQQARPSGKSGRARGANGSGRFSSSRFPRRVPQP